MMIVHRLEGPAHVFRTCITSLYASPSLVAHTEPSGLSHMLDAESNEKRRCAQDNHSIDRRTLARSTTPTSFFVKRSIFTGLRERSPRVALAAKQSTIGLVDCGFQNRDVLSCYEWGRAAEPALRQARRCVGLGERGKFTTPLVDFQLVDP